MISKNFHTLKIIDGIEHIFNHEEFMRLYNLAGKMRGEKTRLKERLRDKTGKDSDETINGWIKGYSGPRDFEDVEIIANIFNVPVDTLLTPRTKIAEKIELEENVMREIKDYERDTARKLYVEMCDMIDGLEYFPEEFTKGAAGLIGCTPQGFRYLGKEAFPFMYRDNLIQNVRKAGFDLPKQTRDQLIYFILDAFGDDCSDTGMMYFESDAYKSYLEKNGFENSDDTRDLYSVLYIQQLYEKLDDIFTDYLQE